MYDSVILVSQNLPSMGRHRVEWPGDRIPESSMRAAQMEKGQTVKVDGKLYAIVDFEHVKLGKGGAVYQT